ncbi:unnamed protein product [Cochlearia groenlandica]
MQTAKEMLKTCLMSTNLKIAIASETSQSLIKSLLRNQKTANSNAKKLSSCGISEIEIRTRPAKGSSLGFPISQPLRELKKKTEAAREDEDRGRRVEVPKWRNLRVIHGAEKATRRHLQNLMIASSPNQHFF